MPRLTIVAASTRPGRIGRQIADWVCALAQAQTDLDVRLVDLAELDLPFHDEPNQPSDGPHYLHDHTRRWSEIVQESDAFVLVMPEYNRGYSAPLKNALDYLYVEWHYKPVGLVNYGMSSAGLRAGAQITPVLLALKMVPVPDPVAIPLRQVVDGDGKLAPAPHMIQAVELMLDELRGLAEALAGMRRPDAVASAG
jgi:NAD(P)H-dependent FMN reductase